MGSGGSLLFLSTGDTLHKYSSSERIKKDITTVSTTDALDRIKALRPVEFTPKADYNDMAIDNLWEFQRLKGFIAEEAALVSHDYATYDWWASDDPSDDGYTMSKRALSAIQDEWTDEEVEAHYPLDDMKPTAPDMFAILADSVAAIQALEARIAVLEG